MTKNLDKYPEVSEPNCNYAWVMSEIALERLFSSCTGKGIYKSQIKIINEIHLNRNIAIMKPRQIFGVDTAIICYLIQKAIGSSWNSVIYCNDQDAVFCIASKIEQMLKLAEIEFSTRYYPKLNQPEFTIDSGSLLIRYGIPLNVFNLDCCYFSEASFIPNLEELVSLIAPVLKPDGKIVMASTQNWGNPNLFSDIFLPENDGSDWNKIILDWRDLHEITGGFPEWGETKRLVMGLSQSQWDQEYEPIIQFN